MAGSKLVGVLKKKIDAVDEAADRKDPDLEVLRQKFAGAIRFGGSRKAVISHLKPQTLDLLGIRW